MTMIGTKTAFVAALAVAGAMTSQSLQPAHAAFDICKDARITVTNNTGAPVQVFDLDYIDTRIDRKRSENISNRVLKNGASYTWERNLEGVKDTKIKIRAQYRKLKSNGKWRLKTYNKHSSTKKCTGDTTYSITLR